MLKLSLELLCKNLILTLLIVAQLCAATVFGIMTFALRDGLYDSYNLSKNFVAETYIYSPEAGADIFSDESSAIYQYSKSGKIELSRSKSEMVWQRDPRFEAALTAFASRIINIENVYSYGSGIGSALKSQLKQGEWYTDAEKQEGIINCVIIGKKSEFPIGALIYGAEYDIKVTVTEGKATTAMSFLNKYTFKVVGSLGEEAKVFSLKSISSPAEFSDSENFFETISYRQKSFFETRKDGRSLGNESESGSDLPAVSIICDAADMITAQKGGGDNALFTFSNEVAAAEKAEILDALKKEAGIVTMERARENSKLAADGQMAMYIPLLICFLAMAVVGIVCIAVLNMYKSKQAFRAYVLCGMSFWQGVALIALYAVMLLILTAVLTVVVWLALLTLGILPLSSMKFGAAAYVFAAICVVMLLVLMAFSSLPILKKYFSQAE